MMLYVVNKNENPAYKIGWIILISFVPLFGGLLYLFTGTNARPRECVSHSPASSENKAFLTQDTAVISQMEPRARATAHYVAKHGVYPVWENTNTQYFPVGEDMYKAMLKELEKSRTLYFPGYFIIARDSMWNNILKFWSAKAAQGVDVRLIYDDMGSVDILPAGYARQMEKEGHQMPCIQPFVPFF